MPNLTYLTFLHELSLGFLGLMSGEAVHGHFSLERCYAKQSTLQA